MSIPKTRTDLVVGIDASYRKLEEELECVDERLSGAECVDGWTVKDLLAVRVWWSEAVVAWIRRGRDGEAPVTPAKGFKWSETPRLNAEIIRSSRRETFNQLRDALAIAVQEVFQTIDELDDTELLEVGVYPWAGKWPLSRWLSVNTTRQYTTARKYIRRVTRPAGQSTKRKHPAV